VYVRCHLKSKEWIFVRNNDTIELLWIHIYGGTKTTFIGALYHPPKPIFATADLLTYMEEATNHISSAYPGALIVLCGDESEGNWVPN